MPMVRISQETLEKINELSQIFTQAVQAGRMRLPITDQGAKGSWVTAETVVAKAITELIDHRERSKKSNQKARARKSQMDGLTEGRRDYHHHHRPDEA